MYLDLVLLKEVIRSSCLKRTVTQSKVALLTAGSSQKERMGDKEKVELDCFQQDPLTSSLDYIQHDAGRGGSRAGIWGGYLIHFIVFFHVVNFLRQLPAIGNTKVFL